MVRGFAVRVLGAIALAATVASAPLIVLGLTGGPLAALAALAVVAFALGSAWLVCTDADRELVELARCVRGDGEPDREVRTPPATNALALAVDRLRKTLARTLETSRNARASAELTEKYETEFLQTLSHELRTPLNSVLGFSQVLLDEIDGPLTVSQKENVRAVLTSGEHLKSLVDDVLDLAALSAGRITLKRQRVDVGPLVDEIVRLLESQRAEAVVLGHSIDVDAPPVDADPKRLRQILWNLAGNAVKFTKQGRVSIAVRPSIGDRVRIIVSDTGPGIPAQELDAIFEEFVQAEGAERRPRGSGLGLSICKRLTELHAGEIHVRSEVGKGSEFEVVLPAWRFG